VRAAVLTRKHYGSKRLGGLPREHWGLLQETQGTLRRDSGGASKRPGDSSKRPGDSCKRLGGLLQETRGSLPRDSGSLPRDSGVSSKRLEGLFQETRGSLQRDSGVSSKRLRGLFKETRGSLARDSGVSSKRLGGLFEETRGSLARRARLLRNRSGALEGALRTDATAVVSRKGDATRQTRVCTADRRRMATRRVGSRWSRRSARPPVNAGGRRIDPGGRRGSNTKRRESPPRPLRGRKIGLVRGSGGLALRARPPATVRDAIRRRKTSHTASG